MLLGDSWGIAWTNNILEFWCLSCSCPCALDCLLEVTQYQKQKKRIFVLLLAADTSLNGFSMPVRARLQLLNWISWDLDAHSPVFPLRSALSNREGRWASKRDYMLSLLFSQQEVVCKNCLWEWLTAHNSPQLLSSFLFAAICCN